MSYTVLARKYRPQTFADLVGQEHVTRTLSNAIETGRVAHAFLFTGVRGVGKTTSARILAKALNCEQGPTPAPCNVCDACVQITAGVDLDVLEIDGASNNGVDDVRRLQESLPYRPARDRFKVVIVDEVHMLTTGAFNAFLKTLEEPPAHVKFIFATTESHKVPITIRSRCQRYDFRLIAQSVIAEQVGRILAAENIEADAHAIGIVAREAAGSMRDALTLLDQIVAFSGDTLIGSEVTQKLGLADRECLFRIAETVLEGNARGALEVIEAVASQGLDLVHFTRQWLELLRDMVVLQVADDRAGLVELPADERARALGVAKQTALLELERVFAGVAKLIDEVSKSSAPRLLLEMGAVRLATRPPLQDLSELLARLARADAGGGAASSGPSGRPPAPQAPPTPQGPPPGRPPPPRGNFEPPSRGMPDPQTSTRAVAPARDTPSQSKPNPFQRYVPPESSSASAPRIDAPAFDAPHPAFDAPHPASAAASMAASAAAPATATVTPIGQARSAALAQPSPIPAKPLASPSLVPSFAPPSLAPPPFAPGAAQAPQRTQPAAAPPPPAPRPASSSRDLAPPHPHWIRMVEELRKGDPRWSAMFEHGVATELSTASVVVVFQEGSFFGRQAQSPAGLEALVRAANTVLGGTPEPSIRFALELPGVTLAQRNAAAVDERKEAIKRKALSHPRVIEALKVFPELGQKQDVQVD